MACTKLNVRRVHQFTDEWCGPACAHMILLALKLVKNDSKAVQGGLWTEIQGNTGSRSAGFPLIEKCGDPPPLEWATHPIALQKTLNAHIEREAIKVKVILVPEDEDEGVVAGDALKSVKHGIAAAVLVEDATHWIVVFGCEHSTRRGLSTLDLNGDTVTHILVRDPAFSSFPARMTLDMWKTSVWAVTCGKFKQKYVVVGAK